MKYTNKILLEYLIDNWYLNPVKTHTLDFKIVDKFMSIVVFVENNYTTIYGIYIKYIDDYINIKNIKERKIKIEKLNNYEKC